MPVTGLADCGGDSLQTACPEAPDEVEVQGAGLWNSGKFQPLYVLMLEKYQAG